MMALGLLAVAGLLLPGIVTLAGRGGDWTTPNPRRGFKRRCAPRPDDPAPLQPFDEQIAALAVLPNHLHQVTSVNSNECALERYTGCNVAVSAMVWPLASVILTAKRSS